MLILRLWGRKRGVKRRSLRTTVCISDSDGAGFLAGVPLWISSIWPSPISRREIEEGCWSSIGHPSVCTCFVYIASHQHQNPSEIDIMTIVSGAYLGSMTQKWPRSFLWSFAFAIWKAYLRVINNQGFNQVCEISRLWRPRNDRGHFWDLPLRIDENHHEKPLPFNEIATQTQRSQRLLIVSTSVPKIRVIVSIHKGISNSVSRCSL